MILTIEPGQTIYETYSREKGRSPLGNNVFLTHRELSRSPAHWSVHITCATCGAKVAEHVCFDNEYEARQAFNTLTAPTL